MKLRRSMAAGAFAASLAAGGVAGAVLFTPLAGVAQEVETPDAEAPDAVAPDVGSTEAETPADAAPSAHRRGGMRHVALATAAEAIGIEESALRDALADGQSMAEVAQANGVDPQVVTDALVAEATTRLEQALAELPERMADVVERQFDGRAFEGGPPGHHHRGPAGADADAEGSTTDGETEGAEADGGS